MEKFNETMVLRTLYRFANKYEKEDFTKGTVGEVDFILKEINHDKNCKILDIGGGTGRRAI